MVRITNGINTFEVTKGAFDGIFSHQGYHIVGCNDNYNEECKSTSDVITDDGNKNGNEDVDGNNVSNTAGNSDDNDNVNDDEKSEDDKYCEEILEKPIAQWSKEEIKKFAEIKEIDITGTKNAGEARDRIKAYLEDQE